MNISQAKTLKPGDVLRYNDGRPGHTAAFATVLNVTDAIMTVQFHDRADVTSIRFNEAAWMDCLTLAPLPDASALAKAFGQALRAVLTETQLAEVVRINAARRDESCASHDFCDANVVMDEAFKVLAGFSACETGGDGIGCMSDAATAVCNAAWSIAKRAGFSL